MSYEQPSLKLSRPILGMEQSNLYGNLRQELQAQGVEQDHHIKFFNRPDQALRLLTAGEMWIVFRHFDLEPGETELDDLGDYLDTHLPDSKNSNLVIPSLPVGEYLMAGSQATKVFTIAAGNPTVLAEKEAAKLLIEEYFGIEDEPGVRDVWPNWEYVAGAWLAKSRFPDAIDKMRNVFQTMPDLLPAQIELGPLSVEADIQG
jgi:hypothetical protein